MYYFSPHCFFIILRWMLHHQYRLCLLGKEKGEGHRATGSCQLILPPFNVFLEISSRDFLLPYHWSELWHIVTVSWKEVQKMYFFFRAGHIATWNKRGVRLVRENGREDIRWVTSKYVPSCFFLNVMMLLIIKNRLAKARPSGSGWDVNGSLMIPIP